MERILVVEDDDGIRDLLFESLRRWGHEPLLAENGKIGLEKFKEDTVSAVITDIRMPVMDGLTMLREMKQEKPNIPIIVITGYPSVDSAVESLMEGADYYLVKPIKLDDLEIKVKKSLEKRDMLKTLSTTKVMNRVLIFSIPIWIAAGYFLAQLWQ